MGRYTLEVCAGSLQSVRAAAQGGAQRVELCAALGEGGITPSVGFIREARKLENLMLHVLIRPRGGDFLYDADEVVCMEQDIRMAGSCGADGVVIGALTADGRIDKEVCRRLVAAAGEMNVTFHRAFDLCRDPFEALDDVLSLGCNRILTSGQAVTAESGIPLLRELVNRSSGCLTILPGSGVTAVNARRILEETGAVELHASARMPMESAMRYRRAGVSMGTAGTDEYSRKETSSEEVSALLQAMDGVSGR